jgi:hypothetical protein
LSGQRSNLPVEPLISISKFALPACHNLRATCSAFSQQQIKLAISSHNSHQSNIILMGN